MRSARVSRWLAAALACGWAISAGGALGEDWATEMFETTRHDFGSVAGFQGGIRVRLDQQIRRGRPHRRRPQQLRLHDAEHRQRQGVAEAV